MLRCIEYVQHPRTPRACSAPLCNFSGYFDNYGIIRDIMQNHLLQVLALFAMEQPVSMDAEDIRNEKVKLLRSIRPIALDDVVIGQYKGREANGASALSVWHLCVWMRVCG